MRKYMVVFNLKGERGEDYGAVSRLMLQNGWYEFVLCEDSAARRLPASCYFGAFPDLAHAKISFDETLTGAERLVRRPIRIRKAALLDYRVGLFASDDTLQHEP